MNMNIDVTEINKFADIYLEEAQNFRTKKLGDFTLLRNKKAISNKKLIFHTIRHELKQKDKLKYLIADRNQNIRSNNLKKLNSIILGLQLAEEKVSSKADFLLGATFITPLIGSLSALQVKLLIGDTWLHEYVPYIFSFLTLFIATCAWNFKNLASDTKCLIKIFQGVADDLKL